LGLKKDGALAPSFFAIKAPGQAFRLAPEKESVGINKILLY